MNAPQNSSRETTTTLEATRPSFGDAAIVSWGFAVTVCWLLLMVYPG